MEILIGLAVVAIVAAVFGAIFHKMGFSRFTGVLAVIPIVNLVWWLYLATSEWPIERELAMRGDPDQRRQEDHITLMFRRAERCERYGDFAEAVELFETLAEELEGKPGARVAKHCAERLRERGGPT
ncbi:MAG: hypothetical protein GXX96_00995 [Planctomycetaceae bacterium]|nr:hypothetical protein [Planctomycetaceae bacterium]